MWDFRWRVVLALTFLVTAKLANIGVPLLLKEIVDSLDKSKAILVALRKQAEAKIAHGLEPYVNRGPVPLVERPKR